MDIDKSIVTPRGSVQVRFAEPQDAKLLRALRLEALSLHPMAFSADYESAVAQTEEAWIERLTQEPQQGKGIICVASTGRELVGIVGMHRGTSSKTKHRAMIWGVYVRAEWRGHHIAEQLIHACLAWGKEQGILVAEIGVISENGTALRCYLRCGFRVFGVEPKAIFWNGVYYDELLMTLEL